jgi:hypothetical protein
VWSRISKVHESRLWHGLRDKFHCSVFSPSQSDLPDRPINPFLSSISHSSSISPTRELLQSQCGEPRKPRNAGQSPRSSVLALLRSADWKIYDQGSKRIEKCSSFAVLRAGVSSPSVKVDDLLKCLPLSRIELPRPRLTDVVLFLIPTIHNIRYHFGNKT